MNILIEEHKQFIIQLLESKVEFILIGGYAVIFHGYGRTTGDMDLWLKPENSNRDKLISVLNEMGILKEDIDKLKARMAGIQYGDVNAKQSLFFPKRLQSTRPTFG